MEQITIEKILCETHVGLERQGPGSMEMTVKALNFIGDLCKISRVADMGCGTGGQTMVLAQNLPAADIVGVDLFPEFIDAFNAAANKLNLQDRVRGIAGSMDALSFPEKEFDLIWSEGAINEIGFEKGLNYWNSFLKKNGCVAVTCASWFTDERPEEIDRFWADAGCELDTVGHNVLILQKAGYRFLAAFALPESCWRENYFIPRGEAEKAFAEKYPGSKTVETYLAEGNREVELYSKYSKYYGYVFYVGEKI